MVFLASWRVTVTPACALDRDPGERDQPRAGPARAPSGPQRTRLGLRGCGRRSLQFPEKAEGGGVTEETVRGPGHHPRCQCPPGVSVAAGRIRAECHHAAPSGLTLGPSPAQGHCRWTPTQMQGLRRRQGRRDAASTRAPSRPCVPWQGRRQPSMPGSAQCQHRPHPRPPGKKK